MGSDFWELDINIGVKQMLGGREAGKLCGYKAGRLGCWEARKLEGANYFLPPGLLASQLSSLFRGY